MNKLMLLVLLATCCLMIAGCSNDVITPKDESEISTHEKINRVNKAWYKHI
ncbi:YgdI/YgdR family lipoprotein [Bacillus dicomae]|uniref:YgdI/YgdR family lipoprotein n=1 Tax=Bacillus dicomae TaxID=3088378 RepID=UPI001F0F10F4|nr:YgdI/YgdR family lipoprotein [Bacillus dicomae]